ncbi:MAG: hypothetical protein H6836_02665 [Planctomycetes bacterium]|nr:hypothetical protein [Planctomycetota bacterium]
MLKQLAIGLGIACCLGLQSCRVVKFMQPVAHAHRLTAAPPGMALVNFHRPSDYLREAECKVFDQERLIGNTKGEMGFQYVCPPGLHTFLGRAAKGTGLRAELAADKVYDVRIEPQRDIFHHSFSLEPMQPSRDRALLDVLDRKEPLWALIRDTRTQSFEDKMRGWTAETAARLGGPDRDQLQVMHRTDHR